MAEEYELKMQKAIEATEREFSKIRTSVATPAILNNIRVDYYGTPTPIPQVAKVTVPEPRMLLVTPWEKTMVEPINRAIQMANIGVSPIMDGNGIRVAIPILTAERRVRIWQRMLRRRARLQRLRSVTSAVMPTMPSRRIKNSARTNPKNARTRFKK